MKRASIMTLILGAVTGFTAGVAPWLAIDVASGRTDGAVRGELAGQLVAPALNAFAVAAIALAVALLMAGPILRRVLGGLTVVLGLLAGWQTLDVLIDPVRAVSATVRAATGVGDLQGVRDILTTGQVHALWGIWLGMLMSLILIMGGGVILITAPRWLASSARFAPATAPADGAAPPPSARGQAAAHGQAPDPEHRETLSSAAGQSADFHHMDTDTAASRRAAGDRRILQWDTLSHGDDPTEDDLD